VVRSLGTWGRKLACKGNNPDCKDKLLACKPLNKPPLMPRKTALRLMAMAIWGFRQVCKGNNLDCGAKTLASKVALNLVEWALVMARMLPL
jgi:hypothetical protein